MSDTRFDIGIWGCIVCANVWAASDTPLVAWVWLVFGALIRLGQHLQQKEPA